jgi:chromosome segregation ATPase
MKIDTVLLKLSKLETIESQQALILSRLTTIETDIATNRSQISESKSQIQDIANGQTYLSDKYDDVLKKSDTHEENLKKIQGELKVLSDCNKNLQKQNKQLQEDVTDVRCRSMRDNLVMPGISEHPHLLQDSIRGAPAIPLHMSPEASLR